VNPGKFFTELKRRNVYKVAVAYGVVGWLVIQVAATIVPALHLGEGMTTAVVVIVLLGFPVALVIAWAFEMTPEGMKWTEDIRPDEKIPRWSRRKFAALIILVSIAAAGLLAYQLARTDRPGVRSTSDRSGNGATEALPVPLKSIAVLPFESLSEDKANAYFAEGIQDEILTRLSKIADLKVISRTSTQRYKSAPADLKEIAKQLGVANILEGSVQRASDQVRVTVQLINATTDAHLWAETYDRKLLDTFQVESDIAQKIAGVLEAKLTGREKAAINMRETENPQAYETYLRAIALRDSQSDADGVRMRDLLRETVRLDPNFVEAWAWLTVLESVRYFFPEESPAQKERARAAADTALRLAPESADAQGAMGVYYYYVEKNYDEALRWLDRARAIAPNDWKFISATALVKRRQGKLAETIALQKHGAELDPLNVDNWVELAGSYRGRRELEQTRLALDRALAISPNDANIIAAKAETYAAAGDLEKSWQLVRDLKFGITDNGVGIVLEVALARRDYDEALRRIKAMTDSGNEPPLFLAIDQGLAARIEFMRGNRAAAEATLREAERRLMDLHAQHEGGRVVLDHLIQVEACLGRGDEVERLGEQIRGAVRLDKWAYPFADTIIATAYAQMGNADRAIPLLETVLGQTYIHAVTAAQLRVDPRFDGIRGDPRFQKLTNAK
jgi:TolB-like protein/Tfp pilus assembly protein PilF